MGDRREFQDGSLDYFQLLDIFMSTFSQEAEGKGLEPPLFHVFSETLVPCPSGETGLFDEFPTWPVELDQVREEGGHVGNKKHGYSCSAAPNRHQLG